jgi:hypothetical protein
VIEIEDEEDVQERACIDKCIQFITINRRRAKTCIFHTIDHEPLYDARTSH